MRSTSRKVPDGLMCAKARGFGPRGAVGLGVEITLQHGFKRVRVRLGYI